MTTVTREHLEDEVLKSIQKKAESIMPKDAKVILFGSRARRDAKADSDWDILVLLNKDKIDEQDHDNYTYPLWELGWQINQMIHPVCCRKQTISSFGQYFKYIRLRLQQSDQSGNCHLFFCTSENIGNIL